MQIPGYQWSSVGKWAWWKDNRGTADGVVLLAEQVATQSPRACVLEKTSTPYVLLDISKSCSQMQFHWLNSIGRRRCWGHVGWWFELSSCRSRSGLPSVPHFPPIAKGTCRSLGQRVDTAGTSPSPAAQAAQTAHPLIVAAKRSATSFPAPSR